MVLVAKQIGVVPPTSEDLEAIMMQLDDDFDGQVSKEEFFNIVMLIMGKMLEMEEELMKTVNAKKNN